MRPELVARAGLSGIVVAEVERGSPAAEAGLVPLNRRNGELGDIIVAVNGRTIDSLSGFVAELDKAGIDNTAELTVRRGERERKVKVRVIDLVR